MKLACVQDNVVFGNPEANVAMLGSHLRALASECVDLAIFPEAFLTGYVTSTREESLDLALTEAKAKQISSSIQAVVNETGVSVVVGTMEREGDRIYNAAWLICPSAPKRSYRKTHLPFLGIDRFATPGDALPVFDLPFCRLGILICFDLRIPEASRTLALRGAQVIVLPTNWPSGAERTPAHFLPARAAENVVFYAACDRVGTENGASFIGESRIVAPNMDILASAGDQPAILIAEFDPKAADSKTRVVIPGEYETNTFSTRQPTIYQN